MAQRMVHIIGVISAVSFFVAGCQTAPKFPTNDALPGPTAQPSVSPTPLAPDPALLNDGLDDALKELETVE